jgi:hypothetical protein
VAAAAKRPVINGAAPLLGGAGFSLAVSFWLPAQAASPLVLGVSAYLLFLMAVSGLPVFRQALQRQTLVRPLPVPAWQVVAAEVAPRVLILSLFGWGAGFPLLLTGVPLAPLAAVLLIPCAPALIACLNLVQYGAALWFPDAQDKLQQLLGGVASLFLTGLVIGVLIPFLLVPLLLGAPFWAIGLSFFLACAGGAALLLFLVSLLYRRHESRG